EPAKVCSKHGHKFSKNCARSSLSLPLLVKLIVEIINSHARGSSKERHTHAWPKSSCAPQQERTSVALGGKNGGAGEAGGDPLGGRLGDRKRSAAPGDGCVRDAHQAE